jgi:hypothetical protein
MGRDAHVGFVDGEFLLVDGILADIQKVGETENLHVLLALGAGRHLDDGFGTELLPRVDVDRIVEGVHALRRILIPDDVEHPREREVVTDDGAHHHVFEIRRERREDRDAGKLFLLVPGDDQLAELCFVGLGCGRGCRRGSGRRGRLSRGSDGNGEDCCCEESDRSNHHGHFPENLRGGRTLPRMSG